MIFLVNPLHFALHHDRTWVLAANYPFLASRAFLPIARSEVRSLAQQAPLAIYRVDDTIQAVVLIDAAWTRSSLFDENLAWRQGSPPLAVRYHPFQIIEDGRGSGDTILGVAADPACILKDGSGEPFYDHLAVPLPKVQAIYRRLRQIDRDTRRMTEAARSLVRLGVTLPLPIVDAAGRPSFETINMSAFEKLIPSAIVTITDRPQDVIMLAHALDHSGRLHLAPFHSTDEELRHEPYPAFADPAGTGFLIEDDLVMTFS